MGRDQEYLAFVRLVERARAAGQAPGSIAEERAETAADLAGVPREPVASVEDLTVSGAGGPRPARLYRPTGTPSVALVFLHGGGWYVGDIECYDPIARVLANRTGCAILSVGYRLAPEYPYPSGFEDAVAAANWAAIHAYELGVDRIGVAGDSAGGNLAAAVALHARDTGGPALSLQLLVYPALDLTRQPSGPPDPDGVHLQDSDLGEIQARYLGGADPADPYVSPLLAPRLDGVAPAVIAAAEYDRLRPEAAAYADRLRAAGVPVTYLPGEGLDHAYLGWAAFARTAENATRALGAAVRTMLAIPSAA
jgi:acetyl esterase